MQSLLISHKSSLCFCQLRRIGTHAPCLVKHNPCNVYMWSIICLKCTTYLTLINIGGTFSVPLEFKCDLLRGPKYVPPDLQKRIKAILLQNPPILISCTNILNYSFTLLWLPTFYCKFPRIFLLPVLRFFPRCFQTQSTGLNPTCGCGFSGLSRTSVWRASGSRTSATCQDSSSSPWAKSPSSPSLLTSSGTSYGNTSSSSRKVRLYF